MNLEDIHIMHKVVRTEDSTTAVFKGTTTPVQLKES